MRPRHATLGGIVLVVLAGCAQILGVADVAYGPGADAGGADVGGADASEDASSDVGAANEADSPVSPDGAPSCTPPCLDGGCAAIPFVGHAGQFLALHGGYLYWLAGTTIERRPTGAAGPVEAVVTVDRLGVFTVDDDGIFLTAGDGTVQTCKLPCTKPSTLTTSAQPYGITTDSVYLYWADNGVKRLAKMGGAVESWSAPQLSLGVAVNDNQVFLRTDCQVDSFVKATPGSIADPVIDPLCGGEVSFFALSKEAVYATDGNVIVRSPLGSGAKTTINGLLDPAGLFATCSHFVWAQGHAADGGPGRIAALPYSAFLLDGGIAEAPTVLSPTGNGDYVVADSTGVYWLDKDPPGAIMRLAP